LLPVLGLILLTTLPSTASANTRCDLKEGHHLGMGYVGNMPTKWMGLCLFNTSSEGVGLYLSMTGSVPMVSGRDDFYDDISVLEAEGWGDSLLGEEDTWLSWDLGVTRVLSSSTALYVGVGYTMHNDYYNYYDEFHILGTDGNYWVEGDTAEFLNVFGGLMVALGQNWGLQVGADTRPGGVSVGVFFIS